jgi:ferrochelatase
MIRELIVERLDPAFPRRALGTFGPSHDVCPADCCLSGMTRPGARPSAT